jgi:hypothetical protein
MSVEVKLLAVEDDDGKPIVLTPDDTRETLVMFLSAALQKRRDAFLRYRHYIKDSIAKQIAINPKLAEWRCKTQVESSKEWLRRRKAYDDADHDVEILRTLLGVEKQPAYGGMS